MRSIVFGPYRLDLHSEQLHRGNEPLPLRPKTFAVLRYLAERPGALVTKRSLLDAVWPGTAITEDTLTKSIGELREALADDARAPRFIETVHRRGFRFVAATESRAKDQGQRAKLEMATVSPPDPLALSLFVGHAADLARLERLLEAAREGRRQLVFVTGEPGIGKTTLVEQFTDVLIDPTRAERQSRELVAVGRCVDQQGPREAYLPWLDALERLARVVDPAAFVALLRRHAPSWLAQLPWLLEPADAAALRQSLGEVRPERMMRELAVALEELTVDETLVLVLEDLHWSDESTVALLLMLAQRTEPARLLVIGTYRPADAAVREHSLLRAKQTLQQRRRCREIALTYLVRKDVQEYLGKRFPLADFPPAFAALIHQHTDGNPLFIVAVIDQLIGRGWLVETDRAWALTVPLEALQLEIPDDLRQMIRAKLELLTPAETALLEAAAVGGFEVSPEEVAAILDLDRVQVEARCERFAALSRFLRIAGTAEVPSGAIHRSYTFIHELYRQVVYEGIPEGRRQATHQRLATALAASHAADPAAIATRLAVHFERGRDYRNAIAHLILAACTAQARFAAQQAIHAFEAALMLLRHLPDENERGQREIEIRIALGAALNAVYGYASKHVRANYERARTLCTPECNLEQRFEVEYALWYCQTIRGEPEARVTAAELTRLADHLEAPSYRLRSQSAVGRQTLFEGRFDEAHQALGGMVATWDEEKSPLDPSVYGVDPVAAVYGQDGLALWFLGRIDPSRARLRQSLAVAQRGGQPFTLAAVYVYAALWEILCRNPSAVLEHAGNAVRISGDQGYPHWRYQARVMCGWAQARLGDPEGGLREINEGIRGFRTTGAVVPLGATLAFCADTQLSFAVDDLGAAAIAEGLELARTTLDRVYEPELWRLDGERWLASRGRRRATLPASGRPRVVEDESVVAAEGCFQKALVLTRERGSKSLELRAATSLARLWNEFGRTAEARDLLTPIYSWFSDGHDTGDLREARAFLTVGAPATRRQS